MQDFVTCKRDVPPACFALLILPLLVYLLHEAAVPQVGVPVLDVTAAEVLRETQKTLDLGFTEAAGRNRFLGALLFFAVVVLVALVAFFAELSRGLTPRSRNTALGVFAAVQVPVILVVLGHHLGEADGWRSYHQLGRDVLETVLARGGPVEMCVGTDGTGLRGFFCGSDGAHAFRLFALSLDLVSVLSGLGVAALVLGMILSLARPVEDASLELRAFDHGRNQRVARRFLYLAGLMMSAGLFFTMSWMHWPFPMLTEDAAEPYADVIKATLFYYGVFYTLLIVSGFGPVLFLAARRSDELALQSLVQAEEGAETVAAKPEGKGKTPGPSPARPCLPTISALDDWKAAHGLRISFTEALQALFAAGSPLLTAFAGSFAPL